MTQDDGITATGRQSGARGSVRPRLRVSRTAAAATAVLAAGTLLAGCGEPDPSSMGPHRVEGQAAPAGGDRTDKGLHDKKGEGKSGSSPGAPSMGQNSSGASSAGGGGDSGGSGGSGEANGGLADGGADGDSGSGCQSADLGARFGPQHSGAGQENFSLVLTNNSGRTCTLRGYPGLAFVNSAGQQVSVNPQRAGGSVENVSLAPGASAWAPLSFANPAMTGVRTVAPDRARITPPDQTRAIETDWTGGPVTDSDEGSVPKLGPLSPGVGS
ncbi:DUF4232 domain-containing protein [Streptomyces sp. NBC_01795]|uniref:DUF4232 domain-containing protein n=1 Tax=unclassified Streptomyces TaxID=2593676 RepID=UPI002DDBCFAF|nr:MULTISPECIES: DUF4232 domain-containing protein [unclassified Streptomyces]WSA93806.1 DUF4232 domain-containing protein [Streptomyces sp. NBC_01795]WSB78176.1 DUF4232 domain-containing protein [Streptomyces sp. NBC_01775]